MSSVICLTAFYLCNGFVTFVIARDPPGDPVSALSLFSARRLLDSIRPVTCARRVGLVETAVCDPIAAALRVAKTKFPWPLVYMFVILPRPLRDWIYDAVARHRYQWFGKRAVCMVPTPDLRARFID